MSARDGLGLLPFSDYADPDPHGQLRLADEEPPAVCGHCGGLLARACPACNAEPGEECHPLCIGGES